MVDKLIKILIVDDSAVDLEFISYILSSEPAFQIIGKVKSGQEAINFIQRNKPDIILMDVIMPGMTGYNVTEKIMNTLPIPIVLMSGTNKYENPNSAFKAIEAGAVSFIEKPVGFGHSNYEVEKKNFIRTVKLMADVRVVRKWTKDRYPAKIENHTVMPLNTTTSNKKYEIVAIGASTGGPQILNNILSALPANFPVPIVIVQHIIPGFLEGMIDWISKESKLSIKIASNCESLLPGCAYFAPDGYQFGVNKNGRIALTNEPPENNLKPAVSHLFRSVLQHYSSKAIAILLTGMGKDGALELKLLRDAGALTYAQDEESSLIFGMPGEAVKLDAAVFVLPPEKISTSLKNIMKI